MQNPISFYLDLVDGAAFDQAESGEPVGQYDAPFTPLFVPWVVGVPLLALTPTSSIAWVIIAGLTLAASAVCWIAVWRFYMNRVYAYRQQLGTERERPDRRLTVLILVATLLGLAWEVEAVPLRLLHLLGAILVLILGVWSAIVGVGLTFMISGEARYSGLEEFTYLLGFGSIFLGGIVALRSARAAIIVMLISLGVPIGVLLTTETFGRGQVSLNDVTTPHVLRFGAALVILIVMSFLPKLRRNGKIA